MPTSQQVAQWLEQAIVLHQRNRTSEARTLYERVLTARPDDPDANHLLGLIDESEGQLARALERLIRARRLAPDNAELLNNLASLYIRLGRTDDALEACRAGLRVRPNLAALHNTLGVAFQTGGRHKQAIASFRNALTHDPDYVEALNNLGMSLLACGEVENAALHLRKAVELAPNYPKALANFGKAMLLLKRYPAAVKALRRSVALRPAAEIFDLLGQGEYALGGHARALGSFDKALAGKPDSIDIAMRRIGCLISLGRPEAVRDDVAKLIERAPGVSQFHAVLGQAHAQLGEHELAIAELNRAIALDENNTEAYQLLSQAQSLAKDIALVATMQAAYERTAPNSVPRKQMAFALGKAKEDQEDYDAALAYFVEANHVCHAGLSYDETKGRRRLKALRAIFKSDRMRALEAGGDPSPAPIFIVGMPRSGTTLVESILGAHHAVEPCGELDILSWEAEKMGLRDRDQPPLFKDFGAETSFAALARAYLAGVREQVPAVTGAMRFADKMPDNFWNIGLIRLAFPNATIIHCRRDPADTCLSIFKTDFNSEGHRYAYDLAELGAYYALYCDAMRHWEKVLPAGTIKTVDYERLVLEPETEIRRLVGLCGLDWDDDCLSFHTKKRVVQTASVFQVRRAIYTSSVDLAGRYGTGLRPLLDALEPKRAA